MSTVRVFKSVGLFVDTSTLGTIARGQLLPSATTLSCHLSHPWVFLDMLTLRLEQIGKTTALRSAVGCCEWTGGGREVWICGNASVEAAAKRIQKINEKFGTQHSLKLRPDLSRNI